MNLRTLTRWLHRRVVARRVTYELDVVDQWLVVLLGRHTDSTYRRLEAELRAIRGTPPAEVVASLLKLEEAGLVVRAPETALIATERRFRLTGAGGRLRRFVPAEPRSPANFYV